jgi:hypothetical protein
VLKRAARFVLLCGLGVVLAVTELFGRRAPLFLPGTHLPVYPAPANLDFEITAGAAGERPSC